MQGLSSVTLEEAPLNPTVNVNAVVGSENICILYNSSHILWEKIMNYNVKKHPNFLKQDKRRLDKLKKIGLKKRYSI